MRVRVCMHACVHACVCVHVSVCVCVCLHECQHVEQPRTRMFTISQKLREHTVTVAYRPHQSRQQPHVEHITTTSSMTSRNTPQEGRNTVDLNYKEGQQPIGNHDKIPPRETKRERERESAEQLEKKGRTMCTHKGCVSCLQTLYITLTHGAADESSSVTTNVSSHYRGGW